MTRKIEFRAVPCLEMLSRSTRAMLGKEKSNIVDGLTGLVWGNCKKTKSPAWAEYQADKRGPAGWVGTGHWCRDEDKFPPQWLASQA